MKIKKILVTQPQPSESEKSPYFELAEKNNVKIDFRPFCHVEGVSSKEFRQYRVDILAHTAVVFSSKTAIDHFFRIAEEMRITIPDTMKYFCNSESTAFYLQKYIVYRKRKIFYGNGNITDMTELFLKHKDDKYLIPVSDQFKQDITKYLDKLKIKNTKVIFYKNVSSNLSDLSTINYDIMVFYSPSGIKALFENFPNFEQKEIKIASFGDATAKAIKEAGLRLDIQAPMPQAPSMTMALEQFIKDYNKQDKAEVKAEKNNGKLINK